MALSLLFLASTAFAAEFLVVSDFHYDVAYNGHYNASANCSSELANGQQGMPAPAQAEDFVAFGRYGCDSSLALIESSIQAMSIVNAAPDFILVTGDLIGHRTNSLLDPNEEYNPEYNHELVLNSTSEIVALFETYFPGTQVIFTLGNNDGYEDYWTPSESEAEDFLAQLKDIFGRVNPSMSESFTQLGYYTSVTNDGSLVISLNSNFFSIKRSIVAKKPSEEQLTWLDQQLYSTDRRVIVSLHIPPGSSMYGGGVFESSDFAIDEFVRILQRHQDKIDFVMSGHFHSTAFQLIPLTNLGILVHPSVSPIFGNNPGFRHYISKGSTFDFVDYFMNLKKAEDGFLPQYTYSHIYRSPARDFKQLYEDLSSNEVLLIQYLVFAHGLKDNYGIDVHESYIWKISTGTSLQDREKGRRIALCSFKYVNNSEFEWCKNGLLPISATSIREL
mmetsp:Transcript_4804/g.8964  ORF Transcript_4804/g.8964 Transcript_4804/m.8964 type:complete len:446 (+) Transcript_4804:532-1869(+)